MYRLILFFACNDLYINLKEELTQELTTPPNDVTFVSAKQADEVAKTFFSRQFNRFTLKSMRASETNAKIETIKDGNIPLLHIINYPDGGFIIVSASKNYYPVLAYSDKNSFTVTPEMGGVLTWLEETKEAIKTSSTLDDTAKTEIRAMWKSYEVANSQIYAGPRVKSIPNAAAAFSNRMIDLEEQYGNEGWTFYALPDVEYSFTTIGAWEDMCNTADGYGSPREYTIVGFKDSYTNRMIGPLLTTKWEQGSPYNALIPSGRAAGCASVAMAQTMKHYKFPHSITYNGIPLDWNNMPNGPSGVIGSHIPHLLAFTGMISNTNYWAAGSWALPGNVESGLQNIGYTVSRAGHDFSRVKGQISQQKPVLMVGFPLNVTQGHYWVCDGTHDISSETIYFVEYLFYINGEFVYESLPATPSIAYPGVASGYWRLSFHMNWGWGGSCDGWFGYNSTDSGNGNFQYFRENFYISRP